MKLLIEVWSHYCQSHVILVSIFLEAKPDKGFKIKEVNFEVQVTMAEKQRNGIEKGRQPIKLHS